MIYVCFYEWFDNTFMQGHNYDFWKNSWKTQNMIKTSERGYGSLVMKCIVRCVPKRYTALPRTSKRSTTLSVICPKGIPHCSSYSLKEYRMVCCTWVTALVGGVLQNYVYQLPNYRIMIMSITDITSYTRWCYFNMLCLRNNFINIL